MIALNYAKKVIGGYVLNFYADSYKEVINFPINSSYKTYGVPFPGSVITVVENGIKTNYVLTADRKWIELSLNNYMQLETVDKLPTENISTNVIYKVEDSTSALNKNYVFGQEFDIITSDNIGIITPQITNIIKTHGIPADDADGVTELCTIIACINYYYNTNNKSYDVNMYDNGKYIYKSTTLSDIGIGSPIDEKFDTIEELYNFVNKTIDDILKNPNIDESIKEGFGILDKYNLEYKYTNEPLNDSNLFLNVVEGPVYKYYLYNGLSFVEVGGNADSNVPYITIDISESTSGSLTDEQLSILNKENAYIKLTGNVDSNKITIILNKNDSATQNNNIYYSFGGVGVDQYGYIVIYGALINVSQKEYGITQFLSSDVIANIFINNTPITKVETQAFIEFKSINGESIVGTGNIGTDPENYLKSATYTSNILTITDNKNSTTKVIIPTVNYPVSDVQVNGTSVLNSKVANIDLTPYQKTINASNKISADFITTSATKGFVSDTEKASWNGKQAALVSGTNIKTINGESLLGAGDIVIKFDGNGYVTTTKFEELVAQTPTDVKFNDDGNMVLMHDTTIITKQTPLSLGEMKGPITVVNITSPAEAVNGTITAAQLATLQKSNMNMIMFNHEVFTLMDKGHTEGFLTYTHVGIENDLIYIKTFTITVSTLAWVLNIRPVPKMEYDESTKTLNIVG